MATLLLKEFKIDKVFTAEYNFKRSNDKSNTLELVQYYCIFSFLAFLLSPLLSFFLTHLSLSTCTLSFISTFSLQNISYPLSLFVFFLYHHFIFSFHFHSHILTLLSHSTFSLHYSNNFFHTSFSLFLSLLPYLLTPLSIPLYHYTCYSIFLIHILSPLFLSIFNHYSLQSTFSLNFLSRHSTLFSLFTF